MGKVHVMAPPEGELPPGGRLCEATEDAGADVEVVYHPAAQLVGAYWHCPDCGASDAGFQA